MNLKWPGSSQCLKVLVEGIKQGTTLGEARLTRHRWPLGDSISYCGHLAWGCTSPRAGGHTSGPRKSTEPQISVDTRVCEYPEQGFAKVLGKLRCRCCKKDLPVIKSSIEAHIKTGKHISNLKKRRLPTRVTRPSLNRSSRTTTFSTWRRKAPVSHRRSTWRASTLCEVPFFAPQGALRIQRGNGPRRLHRHEARDLVLKRKAREEDREMGDLNTRHRAHMRARNF